jgi:phosphoribosylamine--glycine ligase
MNVMPTRILIVGGGGREHALAWKLSAEPGVNEVVVAPGSDAIAREARVRIAPHVDPLDPPAVVRLARERAAELVVIGPEAPLAAGVSDALAAAGIAVFGPTAAAARIETSKAFCHEVAEAAGVRMARSIVATTPREIDAAVREVASAGVGFVVKEDGLAAGKGVTVFDPDADPAAWRDAYGELPAGTVVVEERLSGHEASVIAVCDGERAVALPAARDHKRLLDGDRGPNTGGMGAYAPLPDLDAVAAERLVGEIHLPILAELARRGTPFRGFLYAGIMLTDAGPRLLECNARLGDPEAQVILPQVAEPLGPLLLRAARGGFGPSRWGRVSAMPGWFVGIALAAAGYPDSPRRGDRIDGLEAAVDTGVLVFHAGTRRNAAGDWETAGGRVLTVVGRGPDLQAARDAAERGADQISWPGMQRRHDIAAGAAVGAVS